MWHCLPYQVLIFRNAPSDFFFYIPRGKKQICKQTYTDLCVEDYSVVIIESLEMVESVLIAGGMFP